MDRITQATEAARLSIDNAHDLMNDHTHSEGQGLWIAANVKLYHVPTVDEDSVLASLDMTETQRKRVQQVLNGMLDETNLGGWEHAWLEGERRYVHDWLEGCAITSEDGWHDTIDKARKLEATRYPYIDQITGYDDEQTRYLRVIQAEHMAESDRLLNRALGRTNGAHFAGRSGGWLHLVPAGEIRAYIEDVEEKLRDLDDALTDEYPDDDGEGNARTFEAIDEALDQLAQSVTALDELISDCYVLLEEIETMKKGLDFGEYMKDQVMQRIEAEHVGVRTLLGAS